VDSLAIRTDAWHYRSCGITSIAAFVGIRMALIGGRGWRPADDLAALFASAVILLNGTRLLGPAIQDLRDRAPDQAPLAEVAEVAASVDGMGATEKILARRVGGGHRVVLHEMRTPDSFIRKREGVKDAQNVRADPARVPQGDLVEQG
jgi:divalent metal cation (Fe/Co/Zn/Cd) transporter